MDRAITELRSEQGLLGGNTPSPPAAPLSLSSGSGVESASSAFDVLRPSRCTDAQWAAVKSTLLPDASLHAPSAGDFAFDRGKLSSFKDNAFDECMLRSAPFVLMGAADEVSPHLREIVLDGVVSGRAAPVTLKDASGLLKVVNGSDHAQFHRQIRSIKQLTLYVSKGVKTSMAKARDSQRRAASGRDVAKCRASAAH